MAQLMLITPGVRNRGKMSTTVQKLMMAGLITLGWGTTVLAGETNEGPRQLILVSIPHRQLALISGGEIVKIYDTAVGAAASPSPTGQHVILNRIPNPTYYTPGKVIPPGRSNPLGTRWMGLSTKGFGIHGTNVPRSIGKAASHGCIRLRNQDAEDLFEKVRVGDVVEICDESDGRLVGVFGELKAPAAKGTPAKGTPAKRTEPAAAPIRGINTGVVLAMGIMR